MYELYPVSLSHRASFVNFTDEMVEKLSPIRHLDRLGAPVIVSYGTYETPEFIRQAKELDAAVRAAGKPVELVVCENYSHLETCETFCTPYGQLGAAVLKMMGLGSR
jgi:arylformamidase